MLKVTLPDGSVLDVADGATIADVASQIGPGLARIAVAGQVTCDGVRQTVDTSHKLSGDCELSILTATDENEDSLNVLRHSTAHVMAEAICKLFPGTQLVYGPSIENGFYYDIDLQRSITPDDFKAIEEEMGRIIKENRPFTRYELGIDEGMSKLKDEGSRYKIENAERAEGDCLSFYATGDVPGECFEDLCRGPHIPKTGLIKAFSVRQVSRSYYRGDINDQPLQRVYGTAFFKKSSLKEYLEQLEEAKKRDHRVVGKSLDLFSLSDRVGIGLALWHGKGTVLRTELQKYLTGEMLDLGYQMVTTPNIGQLDLYRTSGHFPYYEESQFPPMFESSRGKALSSLLQLARQAKAQAGEKRDELYESVRKMARVIEEIWGKVEGLDQNAPIEKIVTCLYEEIGSEQGYLLKPMNCPHHIEIYASRQRSYRDLPVRLGEYGTVYRWEQSGEVAGLIRVRGFTQDDAHLFCTNDQLPKELLDTVELTRRVFGTLGMTDYRIRLSLRDPKSDKYVGSQDNWDRAEAAIRHAVKQTGVDHLEVPGEAAFYGPKIDFVVRDCLRREWQLGTVQVDYNLPERFDISYVGSDNTTHRPVMIHRTPFGSMERFVGILIEQFAGSFPLWLAPVQVGVASISEKSAAYAHEVEDALKAAGLRSELDVTNDKIGPKKHRFRAAKVNYILVVGEQEAQDRCVNINDRDGKTIGTRPLDEFIAGCHREIETRSLESTVLR